MDGESETFVTHSLRADGFDASEDGTGRDTPLVPVLSFCNAAGDTALSVHEHTTPPITTRHGDPGMVAFSCKDHGADAGDIAPTLRSMSHDGSHANAGGQVAVAFTERGREQGRTFECQEDQAYCLTNPGSGGRTHSRSLMDTRMAVRRLTPVECERLQGFEDNYTMIPYRKVRIEKLEADYVKYLLRGGIKPKDECFRIAADGPRYKALGNSWAVPCVAWIFERMQMVEDLIRAAEQREPEAGTQGR